MVLPREALGSGPIPKVGGTAFFSAPSPSPSLIYLGLRSHSAASLCHLCSGREDASAENLTKQWVPKRLLCGQRWLMSVPPGWVALSGHLGHVSGSSPGCRRRVFFPPSGPLEVFFPLVYVLSIFSIRILLHQRTPCREKMGLRRGAGGGRSALQNAPGRNCDDKTTREPGVGAWRFLLNPAKTGPLPPF